MRSYSEPGMIEEFFSSLPLFRQPLKHVTRKIEKEFLVFTLERKNGVREVKAGRDQVFIKEHTCTQGSVSKSSGGKRRWSF